MFRSIAIRENDPMPPLRVPIRVRPGAGRNAVGGSHPGPHGPALVVAVTAPAVQGRATEAALRAVAAALGVRRGSVTLVTGARGRDKLLAVDPAPAAVRERLDDLLDGTVGQRRSSAPSGAPGRRGHEPVA